MHISIYEWQLFAVIQNILGLRVLVVNMIIAMNVYDTLHILHFVHTTAAYVVCLLLSCHRLEQMLKYILG